MTKQYFESLMQNEMGVRLHAGMVIKGSIKHFFSTHYPIMAAENRILFDSLISNMFAETALTSNFLAALKEEVNKKTNELIDIYDYLSDGNEDIAGHEYIEDTQWSPLVYLEQLIIAITLLTE